VSAIASRGDRLALGLFRLGVSLFSDDGWIRVTEARGLPSNDVNSLVFDNLGNLWVATNNGLARLDRNGRVVQTWSTPDLPCGHVNAVTRVELADGPEILIATSCGIGRFDEVSAELTAWEDRDQGLPHRIVYTLTSWNGSLVAGTNDGLAVRDGGSEQRPWTTFRAGLIPLTDNWITAVAAMPSGPLVVGTYSGGLYVGDDPAGLVRLDGPRYINPNASLVAGEIVLIGGLQEGAYRVDTETLTATSLEGGFGRDVTGFALWESGVLVATRSGVFSLSGF
jgi:ligand-binding sensor domain-containing protein